MGLIESPDGEAYLVQETAGENYFFNAEHGPEMTDDPEVSMMYVRYNKPKNAEGMAELNVWQLKKSMHTCIVDVAAMVDVLVITITASFLKVRNLADA